MNRVQIQKKVYKNDFPISRKLFLWGWDHNDNPSFAVFYGNHEFKVNENLENELEDDVVYTNYIVFSGSHGHFPSFESVNILCDYVSYDESVKRMYYKKDSYSYWNRKGKELKNFMTLNSDEKISFPYFEGLKQNDYVRIIREKNLNIKNFKLANNPNDVLNLSGNLLRYYDVIYELLCNPNIYSRKKCLRELTNSNPPQELYNFILNIGSCELISGLFLELSLLNKDILIKEANKLINSKIDWVSKSYSSGLKRCASIYVNSFDDVVRNERIKSIKKEVNKKKLNLNTIGLKNIIQESEIYGLSDVIGKTAYFLDTQYFPDSKALGYFKRYCRRIIDSYAISDEKKFIKAMKSLFLSGYKNVNYIYTDVKFNYFIRYYLYNSFDEQFPSYEYAWISYELDNKFNKRFDFMPDIWDRHLKDALDIAEKIQIPIISRAFYCILKDNKNVIKDICSYKRLINFIELPHEPISKLFLDILKNRLKNEASFDINVMTLLINCHKSGMKDIALGYFNRTDGVLPADTLIGLLFFNNIQEWTGFFAQVIKNFNESEYMIFLNTFFKNIYKFVANDIVWIEDLKTIFINSLDKIKTMSINQKIELIRFIISQLQLHSKIPDFIIDFVEEIIFSQEYRELEIILNDIEIPEQASNIARVNLTFAFLNTLKLKKIPSDSLFTEILELGTPKILNFTIELTSKYKEQLSSRFSTILIMLESDVVTLNDIAKSVFESLVGEKQKNLHLVIIDSPDKKTYMYALEKLKGLYSLLPADFILRMLEHSSTEVRQYISDETDEIINNLGNGNEELFMYYVKTLLFLPNKVSKSKNKIYQVLPTFVNMYSDRQNEIEQMLLDIGGSNVIADSEMALMALAKIKMGVVLY